MQANNSNSKTAKNNAINNAVQAFLDSGRAIRRDTRKGKRERVGTPDGYFTSRDGIAMPKVDNWEAKLDKLAAIGTIAGLVGQWGSDGRVANSKEELYGLAHCK